MEIYIDQYTFHIETGKYSPAVHGNPLTWDSDYDYYGYDAEVEWQCSFVEEFFEDGDSKILLAGQFESIVEEYAELIEDKLLAKIEEMRDESHECDHPEPDYY